MPSLSIHFLRCLLALKTRPKTKKIINPIAATHMTAVNAPLDRPEWSFPGAAADTALMLADT